MPSARPCLVLIPGTLCDHRVFDPQVRRLRGAARVIALDYRGLRSIRSGVQTLLAQLPPRFALAGFSLGGLWALEMLRCAPQRIEALALIASNAQPGSRRGARRNRALWRLWRDQGPEAVLRALEPRYFHDQGARRHHTRLLRDMARHTPGREARAQFDWAAQRPDGLSALAASRAPLLVVSGARDPLCPPAWQQRIAQARPDAQWVELARCGHFVPLEAPADLARLLGRWLGECVQATPSPERPRSRGVPN